MDSYVFKFIIYSLNTSYSNPLCKYSGNTSWSLGIDLHLTLTSELYFLLGHVYGHFHYCLPVENEPVMKSIALLDFPQNNPCLVS